MSTTARTRALDVEREWKLVLGLLPENWERKAWELRAMRRHRGLDDPQTLLRMLLMHLGTGCSLKETAVRVGQAGWGSISAVGLFKRLRVAGEWLAWMARGLWDRPLPTAGRRRILAVDATTVREAGQTGSLWRVHWCVNLSSLQCEFLELTDVHGGEKFARYPIGPGDLVLGDRGYSNPAGIDYVRQQGGDALVRVNPMSLPLYDRRDGRKHGILRLVRGLRVGEVRGWPAWVKGPENRWHGGRLVAVRRSRAATQRELRKQKKNAKASDGPPGKLARALARYVLVWTSAPASELGNRQVLRHYRLRWQLELVFKRTKSIMGLGQLPKRSDESSRAWLNGKLLVAMLVDKLWRHAESFSPWGYGLGRPPKPVA
jgi:hypothetical protein